MSRNVKYFTQFTGVSPSLMGGNRCFSLKVQNHLNCLLGIKLQAVAATPAPVSRLWEIFCVSNRLTVPCQRCQIQDLKYKLWTIQNVKWKPAPTDHKAHRDKLILWIRGGEGEGLAVGSQTVEMSYPRPRSWKISYRCTYCHRINVLQGQHWYFFSICLVRCRSKVLLMSALG